MEDEEIDQCFWGHSRGLETAGFRFLLDLSCSSSEHPLFLLPNASNVWRLLQIPRNSGQTFHLCRSWRSWSVNSTYLNHGDVQTRQATYWWLRRRGVARRAPLVRRPTVHVMFTTHDWEWFIPTIESPGGWFMTLLYVVICCYTQKNHQRHKTSPWGFDLTGIDWRESKLETRKFWVLKMIKNLPCFRGLKITARAYFGHWKQRPVEGSHLVDSEEP